MEKVGGYSLVFTMKLNIDKKLEMENVKDGALEELEMRPDRQAETHEGDPNGKREEKLLP